MKEKQKSAVIRVGEEIHEEVRKYCVENGIKIGFFAAQALKTALESKRGSVQQN